MRDEQLLGRIRTRLAELPPEPAAATIAELIRTETGGVISNQKVLELLRTLREDTIGAGVVDKLLRLPGVSDVLICAPDQVWLDRGHGLERSEVTFASEEQLRAFAVRLAARCGRRLDDAAPWADGHIPGGVGGNGIRIHAVLAPPAHGGTQVSLRVLRPARKGLAELAQAGMCPPEIHRLLRSIVAAQLSFIVAGGTGAGKTTLLAAMLSSVAETERIICIEDTPELAPAHPHVVKLVTRAQNLEGAGVITQQDLVRQALRMRPDRIVVGEIRGAEVIDLLAALNTGHRGGAGTIHANRLDDVIARFEALGLMGGLDAPALRAQLISAVQVVIVVRKVRTQASERAGDVHSATTAVAVDAPARRCVAEIGVLVPNPARVIPAWDCHRGPREGWEIVQRLLDPETAEMPEPHSLEETAI